MHSILTDEQVLFADAVSRFVDQEYGRGPARPGHTLSRGRLRKLADLGCLSLAIPARLRRSRRSRRGDGRHGVARARPAARAGAGIGHPRRGARSPHPPRRSAPRTSCPVWRPATWSSPWRTRRRRPATIRISSRPAPGGRGPGSCCPARKSLVPCAPVADLLVVSARDEASGRSDSTSSIRVRAG